MRRASLFLAAVLGALGLFAACGDDDASAPSPAPSPAPSATTGAAAGASVNPTSPATRAPAPGEATTDELVKALRIDIPRDLVDGASYGKSDAKATLQLFEDFQCPFCLRFTIAFESVFLEYAKAGKLRLEFKHLAILGPESVRAAVAATCAAKQNVFWPLHERLFTEEVRAGQLAKEQINVGRFSDANLAQYAQDAGAEKSSFAACFNDSTTLALVQDEARTAASLGIRGTPGLVLNGKVVPAPTDLTALRRLLDDATK